MWRFIAIAAALFAYLTVASTHSDLEYNENPFKVAYDLIDKINSDPKSTWKGCQPYPLQPCEHHTVGPRPSCPSLDPTETPPCKTTCTNKLYKKTFNKDHHKVKKAYWVNRSVESIQKEIMKNGPVEAGFDVYEDFLSYRSGVYQPHPSSHVKGGHAVKLIGWGVEKGTPYWLVQNSWNTDWGEKGLFRIRRGNNTCGFEEEINAGIPSTKGFE